MKNKDKKDKKDIHLTVGGVIYNIVKKAKIDSETLTPEEWKKIEADIVEAILATIYPGDEIPEEQLTFSHLASTIAFMNELITRVNSVMNIKEEDVKKEADESDDSGFIVQ